MVAKLKSKVGWRNNVESFAGRALLEQGRIEQVTTPRRVGEKYEVLNEFDQRGYNSLRHYSFTWALNLSTFGRFSKFSSL